MEIFKPKPLTNESFLGVVDRAFDAFLTKGTSRSTDKLKPLHGAIAADIANLLGDEYDVWSQGYLHNRESSIEGRYIDKKVDIAIKRNDKHAAGIAVKFVMQNYSQNSNNYFENMLGETANIRCAGCPYFQIFIIFDKLPYYNRDKEITKWETFTEHNIAKYITLSNDNTDLYMHTPNKTLVYVVHLPEPEYEIANADEYMEYYRTHNHKISVSKYRYNEFGSNVILNDYETFIEKVYHTIKSL